MCSKVIIKELIRKGAEASLYSGDWFGKDAIFKRRYPKSYRINNLDKAIRQLRTINEAKALIKVKKYGINVPTVYEIDKKTSTIIMSYIQGKKLKDLMVSLTPKEKKDFFFGIGRFIARLHFNGHIHGDITTSNIIITPEKDIFIIDFGLHDYSDSIEDKSVDLHLLKRVLISTHGNDYKICFDAFQKGYITEYSENKKSDAKEIIKNINIIETRGRYVKKEDRL
jgi:TP53 regulating kinase-like protein